MARRSKVKIAVSLICALCLACVAMVACANNVTYTYTMTKPTKTAYIVGEEFDPTGFTIVRKGSDDSTKTLDSSEYTLDSSAYNKDVPNTYTINYSLKDSDDFSGSFTVTVSSKAELLDFDAALTIENAEFVFDNAAHGATVFTVPTGASIRFKVGDGEWSDTNPTFTAVGVYNVSYELSKEGYNTKSGSFTVTITALKDFPDTLTIANVSVSYDGAAHGATPFTVPTGATLYFKVGSGEWSGTNPTFTEIGVYNVSYELRQTGYNTKSGSFTVTITRPELTGVTVSNTAYYSMREGELWHEISGTQSGDVVSYSTDGGSTWLTSMPMLKRDGEIKIKVERGYASDEFPVNYYYIRNLSYYDVNLQTRVKARGDSYYLELPTAQEYPRDFDMVRTKAGDGNWSEWIMLGAAGTHENEIPSFKAPDSASIDNQYVVTYEFRAVKNGNIYSALRTLKLPFYTLQDGEIGYAYIGGTNHLDDVSFSVGSTLDLEIVDMRVYSANASDYRFFASDELTITSYYVGEEPQLGVHFTKSGILTVHVQCNEISASVDVKVFDYTTDPIDERFTYTQVTEQPNKSNYLVGEEFDLTGLEFDVCDSTGIINFPKDCLYYEQPDMTTPGAKEVLVYLKHQTDDGYYASVEPMRINIFVLEENLPFVGLDYITLNDGAPFYTKDIKFIDNSRAEVYGEATTYTVSRVTADTIEFYMWGYNCVYTAADKTITLNGQPRLALRLETHMLHGDITMYGSTQTVYLFTDAEGKVSADVFAFLDMYMLVMYSDAAFTQVVDTTTVFNADAIVYFTTKTPEVHSGEYLGLYEYDNLKLYISPTYMIASNYAAFQYTVSEIDGGFALASLLGEVTYIGGVLTFEGMPLTKVDLTDKAVVTFTGAAELEGIIQVVQVGTALSNYIGIEERVYVIEYDDYDYAKITADTVLKVKGYEVYRYYDYEDKVAGNFERNFVISLDNMTLTETAGFGTPNERPIKILDCEEDGFVFETVEPTPIRGATYFIMLSNYSRLTANFLDIDGGTYKYGDAMYQPSVFPFVKGFSDNEKTKYIMLDKDGSAYFSEDRYNLFRYKLISKSETGDIYNIKVYNDQNNETQIVYNATTDTLTYDGVTYTAFYLGEISDYSSNYTLNITTDAITLSFASGSEPTKTGTYTVEYDEEGAWVLTITWAGDDAPSAVLTCIAQEYSYILYYSSSSLDAEFRKSFQE